MVILGGLELVAAGYLLHRHQENKRERARLRDDAAALEESSYPIYSNQRPHSHHGRTSSRDRETSEERHERRRRRRKEKEREEQRKYEYERPGREQSAPPKMQAQRPLYHPPQQQQQQQQMNPQMQPQRPYHPPGQGQVPAQQQGYPPTGIPPNWNQAAPAPQAPQMQRAATPNAAAAASPQPPVGPNGYPQDVKYGFDPAIPHSEVPPPPYTPTVAGPSSSTPYLPTQNTGDSSRAAAGGSIGRERANTLEVRGRHRVRRSVSPNLGVYEEGSEGSAPPRVRFSTEDVVLGEERRSRGRRQDRAPPAY